MIGLPCGEEIKLFPQNTGMWYTDRWTELLYLYHASVCSHAI